MSQNASALRNRNEWGGRNAVDGDHPAGDATEGYQGEDAATDGGCVPDDCGDE